MANATCSADGCARRVQARGLCNTHYSQWYKGNAPLCPVEGCERRAWAGGLCSPHSRRREAHGTPEAGAPVRISPGTCLAFVEMAAAYEGDDCLIYPFTKNGRGYGKLNAEGKRVYAHRLVLTLAVGPPPFPGAEAAHAPLVCHNPSCVNPRHLRWATRAENIEDSKLDGTFLGRRRKSAVG